MSNNAGLNVVPMRDFSRPAPSPQEAQFQRLLKECQALALERLLGSVSAMLDKVEDSLWRLADQTQDRELRDRYIAAKDKALEHRKHIEEQYRANYLTEFDVRARRDRKQDGELSQFALASLELDLVNNEDLDETLKINEMSAKLRRYSEEELNALDQRMGVLIGDANLQGEANPFSPQAICNAYKQTCRQIESNMPALGEKDEFGANGDRDRHLSVGCIFKSQAQAAAESDAAFGKGRQQVDARLADEAGDLDMGRVVIDDLRSCDLQQSATYHHGDAVGHRQRLRLIMLMVPSAPVPSSAT